MKRRFSTHWICSCALLLVLEILFLTMPLLKVELGAFTIVFSALPIAVATIVLDYRASLLLGVVWGSISFAEAFVDSFGLIMLENSFIGTLMVLGISRILVSACLVLIYNTLPKRDKLNTFNYILICFLSSFFNNLFFMGGLYIFFKETFLEIIYPILTASIVFNMIPETVACIIIGVPVIYTIKKYNKYK